MARHRVLDNVLATAEKSPNLRAFNSKSVQEEILRLCKASSLKELRFKKCLDFHAISPEEHYCPIERSRYWIIFDGKRSRIAAKQLHKENTKVLNLWLDESSDIPVWASEDFRSILYDLSEKHCPFIFHSSNYKL